MPETVIHFQIRMPPDLHERLASRAKREKRSVNALVVSILQAADEQDRSVAREPESTSSKSERGGLESTSSKT